MRGEGEIVGKKEKKAWAGCCAARSEEGSTVGVIRGLCFRCETKGGERPQGLGEQRTRRMQSLAADGQEGVSAKAGREQLEEQQRKTQVQQT